MRLGPQDTEELDEVPMGQGRSGWVLGDGLEPGDAYQDGPYVVFTAQFHLRRGYCCNSGCRHCPYK